MTLNAAAVRCTLTAVKSPYAKFRLLQFPLDSQQHFCECVGRTRGRIRTVALVYVTYVFYAVGKLLSFLAPDCHALTYARNG